MDDVFLNPHTIWDRELKRNVKKDSERGKLIMNAREEIKQKENDIWLRHTEMMKASDGKYKSLIECISEIDYDKLHTKLGNSEEVAKFIKYANDVEEKTSWEFTTGDGINIIEEVFVCLIQNNRTNELSSLHDIIGKERYDEIMSAIENDDDES
jgi:hypothetical protein